MQHHLVLRVLLFEDCHGVWVAQALEHDIAAYGSSVANVKAAFERTLYGYVQLDVTYRRTPLASLPQAPSEFWDTWDRVSSVSMPAEG